MNYKEIILNSKIEHMQIQTVDSCNSKCIMCPHKDSPITNKLMDDTTFKRIVSGTKEAIREERVTPDIKIRMYLHNEPLMDPDLFNKITYLKKEIPESRIMINTNGFLMPKYIEEIVRADLYEFVWGGYGDDEGTFQYITGISKPQQQLDEMNEAYLKIEKELVNKTLVKKLSTVGKIGDGSWDTFIKNGFYSRAGFYLDKPFFKTVSNCNSKGKRAKGRNLTFLNFFANGDSPLCCQDWKRTTIMGNVAEQTVLEIMNSEEWFDIRSKTLGKPSDDSFICKWCEVAEGIPYNCSISSQ